MRPTQPWQTPRHFLVVLAALAVTACGGDSDGEGSRARPEQQGVFLDHPVEGLQFVTPSRAGLTNRQGEFRFLRGETVRFRIGDIELGSAAGKAVLTPLDLVPGADASHRKVTNLLRLLQTLDGDCDATTGIQIGPAARAAGEDRSLDFDQSEAAFASDPAVIAFLDAANTCQPLVDGSTARAVFQRTLDYMAANGGRANRLPTANAGPDLIVNENRPVTLSGSGSDPDGSISAYEWTQTAGPAVTLAGASSASASFTAPDVGSDTVLVFRLRVTDDGGAGALAAVDEVSVTVRAEAVENQAPTANAGIDQSVNEGETVTLDGSASRDPEDGSNLSYAWTQTGGPAVTLSDSTAAKPTFTAPQVAAATALSFRLVVRDTQNLASAPDTVTVTVNDIPPGNTPPVADAGTDRSVAEGAAVELDGSASSDPDGTIASYSWTQLSGPAVTLSGADTATPAFTAPQVAGDTSLVFRLTVTDNGGASDSDEVQVTVVDNTLLSVADVAQDEGDSGTAPMVFTVRLSAAQPAPVTVDYATQAVTATEGLAAVSPADYGHASGTLRFEPGETEKTVGVTIVGDTFQENDESFRLALSNLAGAAAGDIAATGTIVNDDTLTLLQVGAAKRSVTPSDAQIAGQRESYLGGTRQQFFHLGGFGFGPFKFLPSYGGVTPELKLDQISNPQAKARCFSPELVPGDITPEACEDETWVRVLVLQEPDDGERVAFVTLDAVGAGNLIQDAVKAAVHEASCAEGACIARENVLFGQTHTHAGADLQGLWGGVPREWIDQALVQGAAAAVREAIRASKPAELVMARGYDERYNNYRRPRYRKDASLHEADTTITVLQARADDGSGTLGTLLQYAAHPTAIGTGDYRLADGSVVRVPHPDYPLGAENDLEEVFGGTALYYNGPIADASASGGPGDPNPYRSVKKRGAALAASARAILEANATPLDPVLETRSVEVTLPITNPLFLAIGLGGVFNGYYQFSQLPFQSIPGLDQIPPEVIAQFEDVQNQLPQPTPVARTLLSRVSIGTPDASDAGKNRLEIVTIPGEATNTFGQYIRRLANEDPATVARPKRHTMLLGLTHNSFGYIIPEEEFSYVDPSGEAGFVLPFTGYEEFVSLGPLTAPLLRVQGYNPLFDAAPEQYLPPWLADCQVALDYRACIVGVLQDRLAQVLGGLGAVTGPIRDGLEAVADGCREFGGPDEICGAFDTVADVIGGANPPGGGADGDPALLFAALDAQTRGCDILDTANCLYPFPNDWFTVPAAPGSIQDRPQGTGRRVNLNVLAMPRNSAGKPVDPSEWNRNDGFSPGALITTFVPGLSLEQTFGLPSHQIGLANIGLSQDPDAPILVLEVSEDEAPKRHLVWSELDQNANQLTVAAVPNVGTFPVEGVTDDKGHIQRPLNDGRAALLIRPAKNFSEGKRYVVVLRKLKNAAGQPIPAQPGFQACLRGDSALPPVQQRCEQLEDKVFPVLEAAGIPLDESLYLAWDFTVASTQNQIGRLRHMRDDAFRTLSADPDDEDCTQLTAANLATCAAPKIEITGVIENPQNGIARRIEGTIEVPNYLAPIAPSPLDDPNISRAVNQFCASAPQGEFSSGCRDLRDAVDIAQGLALPNRLFYNPADGTPAPDANNPLDPTGLRYGDGLPDRNGTLTTRFLCQIPAQATPDNPARASLYGHGQLDRGVAITYEGTPDVAREHNYMFCAVDWFGFRTGDAANVLSALVDLSNFPVIPDASQQGMLNFLFLARAMQHPQGFASRPEFQDPDSGRPVFDRREIFYNGNSQGGIFGGVVLAASKDVNRGVLGSLGMNYSTLLTRSKNFDEYAGLLYNSYTDPLDRQLLFSLIQMLWDRSENNGYAAHLIDNSAFGGPANAVKLDPQFGDPQVTMWSADVMARTMGVPFDNRQTLRVETLGPQYLGVNGRRHPDVAPYLGLEPLDYGDPQQTAGSALIVWDTNMAGDYAHIPPITNTPPRTGPDNHDASQKTRFGRCHMAHFLRTGGQLIDILPVQFDGADCPAVPPAAPTTLPEEPGAERVVKLCAPDAIPGIGGQCITVDTLPVIGPVLAGLLLPVDGVTETLADGCRANAGPLAPACAVTDGLAQVIRQGADTPPPGGDVEHASCTDQENLGGNRSYQVTIPSESGETISFQVLEPKTFDCTGKHPLILQGHGFGGSRSQSGFDNYREAGYAVISIDQRGFGDSSGTVRVMDPDHEGRDLVRILDWAEDNLDYLAYRDGNLLVGAIGGSYGGGFQFLLHNVDPKNRLDALAPDITWHDLRYSLNPGDTLKSAFGLLLTVGGEAGSYRPGLENGEDPTRRGLDPYIVEVLARAVATGEFPREALEWFRYHSPSYWCDLNDQPTMPYPLQEWAPLDPNTMLGTLLGDTPGGNRRTGQPPVDVLLSQGFRDNLFNFNEAWWNYQCARVRGGDVRLLTHQSGHILNLGGLTGAPLPPGTPLDVQAPGGSNNCGTLNRGAATLAWFNEKLRGANAAPLDVTDGNRLCLSLSDNDAIFVPEENLLAPRAPQYEATLADEERDGTATYYLRNAGVSNVPQGLLAQTLYNAGQLTPSVAPLLTVSDANGLILAGIAQAEVTVRTPAGVNDALCAAAPSQVPTLRSGCDSIVYLGLGLKKPGAEDWTLIDDQLTPVRGLIPKPHRIELAGVGERLAQGDQLALLVFGHHPQYLVSASRDASIPAVNVAADLKLPLYAVAAGSGAPLFDEAVDDGDEVAPAPAGTGCTDPATGPDPACFAQGSAVNVVRQLCDYQFLPGVCDHAMFAHGPTGYATDSDPSPDRPFFLAVGAVHEHSSYSDGDPEAIPADYFRAGRTGVNGTGKGVKLDFMFSSEHSDNEKLPITTSAACLSPTTLLDCNHAQDPHHYFKWQATLEQAMQESSYDEDPAGGFTGIRGFEWTNDYYNHLNVYFSTNVVNVKVDGSYVSMDFFWNWLRKPVAQGGGADALVTFNHPGGDPKLTPFDGGQPHNELLQQTRGGSNWNDLEYIPDVDRNVVGIEVNGGDDIEWYVKALDKGWHVGPVAAEDEHGRNWSSHDQDKTLILTRGRSPRDYYWAFKNRRTVSLQDAVIERGTGGRATHPEVYYWADGPSLQEGAPLGSILRDPGAHVLHVDIRGVPAGTRVALISNTTGGQAAPIELGSAGAEGRFMGTRGVSAPASGEDWYFVVACAPDADNTPACGSDQNYWIVTAPIWFGPGGSVAAAQPDYGDGLLGALAQYFARLHGVVVALVSGDPAGAGGQLVAAVTEFIENLAGVAGGLDPQNPGTTLIGLQDEPQAVVEQALSAAREVEPVVLTGERIPAWSVPAAQGLPYPYPSGAATTGEFLPASLQKNGGRSAHNGQMVYPLPGAPMGVEVARIAAYKYENGGFVEIPVQVDQKFPHFLANSASDFSTYSGTDEELTYQWDSEKWNAGGEGPNAEYPAATPDPVTGLDHDDEVVFMARDAGTSQAPPQALPTGDADFDAAGGLQEVVLADPLDPATPRFVYLGLKKPGKTSAFAGQRHYVQYERDDNADQWIDRRAYCDDDPEKIGTSNTGYGPNRRGPVYYTAQGCGSGPTTVDTARRESDDRFPRDGLTVSTDTYRWYASGRWMVRELQIRDPDNALLLGPDLIDRWKGRAFQQSPDSTLSLVGFEDEQVNWEANSTLLGERCGPVRCIREVWGADSGTNVTKTETFYRDAITYRYRVRVHPIPPDGLYTSWDYNRSAMLPAPGEDVPAGRYFTALRPQGVPIDGVNDDVGQVDGIVPVAGQCITPDGLQPPGPTGLCPAFFDAADPSFNLPLAFNNWEQVSGKGRSGSLVYLFELKGPTSLANPLVVPYYRDDACLDDGTGDDPVPRPWPGESYTWNGGKVPQAYDARAGRPLDHSGKTFADCLQRQGAHGAHGIHYFATHDTDNLFVEGKPLTEIDGQQWQFMVPTERPRNVGDHYANVVRAPLQAVVVPRPGSGGGDVAGGLLGALERWGDALLAALGQLGQGNVLGAFNAVFGGAQQFVADLLPVAAQQLGQLAGLALTPPGAEAVDNPAPEPLMAGVARGVLKVPVGAPLGGYLRPPVGGEYIGPDPVGELADNIPAMADGCDPEHPESCPPLVPLPDELRAIHSPYATYSPPSRGYYDSLITKAVALHDGHDYLVLVKTDLIGMLDEVVQDVKAEVRRRTGIELGDGLIMSATHTHDGPGAVANHSTRYFWLAMDAYQHDLYRRMVPQLADVVVAALEDMKPARIGHGSGTEIEGLNGYRRGRLASYDIDKNDALRRRIGVLRVDDAATGEPRAVVINWAAHGIAFDVENQYFSGDVLGAVERETEQLMNIPVAMLVQSVGGDVSPRGVSNDNKLQRIESYGRRLAPQVKAIAEAIPAQNIQTAPDLRSVSQRLILNRERLGYAAHEYPYPWGAGQCGNDIAVPFADVGVKDIPGYDQTGLPVKNPFCLPSPPPDPVDLADNGVAENGAFYPQDSILYAAQIGAVKLLAQPGEPLVEYGVRLLDMAEGFGHARDDVFVWGYAGDHVGYILPPEEVDWATFGGAESTTTFWGWKQGQRFLDVSRALLQALDEGSAPPPHEFQVNYGLYKQLYEATPPAPVTPSLLPGAVVEQPSDIRRFEATRFVFEGGDPVLDFPSVLMERETTPGIWAAVTRANGEPLDTFFEMHLKYRLVSARHLWTVEFEAPKDWPTGNYRFVVSGQALQAGETPYTLTSDSFTVSISSTLQISSPASNNGNCEVTLSYTPRPDNYRVIDPYVPANQPAPVRAATVTFSLGGTPIGSDDSATISGLQASYSIPGACPTGVSASAVDSYGNTTPGGSGGGPTPPPAERAETGASLVAHCRAAAPQPGFCDEFAAQLQPLVEGCAEGGSQFGGDEAEAFCRGVLGGDLDQLIRLCDAASPRPEACQPILSLADVLATRNPWLARRFLNISHRGGADEFPENTLFAYAESLRVGSQMIEADVYQTADGELVVIHDASVDRTTNGSGAVNSMTLAQLKALDAAHWFVPGQGSNRNSAGPHPYRGIATGDVPPPAGYSANDFKIPTLRELLQRFPDTLINLELKPDERGAGSYEGKLAALLAEFGRTDDVIVASFLDTAAAAFKAQAPQVSTSVPTGQVALAVATGQGPGEGVTVGHEAFQVPIEFSGVPVTSPEFVADAHARGLAVHVWTIDDPATMRELLCMGVDGIMTDRPSVLRDVLADFDSETDCGSVPPAAGARSPGLLGLLADYLGGLGQALLLALSGDMTGAQEQFLAAAQGLVDGAGALLTDDPDYSLVASLERLGTNLAATLASLAENPGDTPTLAAGTLKDLRDDAGRLLGASRVVPDAEGACAPDNGAWQDYASYKGALHAHSGYSDGAVGTTPASYFAAAKQRGVDFIGSSEHSDNALVPLTVNQDCLSPDFAECVTPLPSQDNPAAPVTKWQLTLQQARAASDAGFTAFRGFEWTSDRFGHINVFFSRHDFNAKSTEGYTLSMESFWTWFATRPEFGGGADGLAVFNHPGREDQIESNGVIHDPAYAFNGFEYRPEADLRMVGIEVFGKSGDAYDTDNGAPNGGWYAFALDQGWHVGAVGAEDEHGTSWALPNRAKTVLIARDRSEGALREAMFARRFYALAQNHNELRLSFTADGAPMGARLARAEGAQVMIEAAVTAAMPAGGKLELVTNGGQVLAESLTSTLSHNVSAVAGERWYYLRVRRSDGRPVAYSSPVWIKGGGGEYPVCGEWLAGDLHVHTTYSHDSYGGPNEIAEPLSQVLPGVLPGDDNTGPEEFYTFGHTVERQFLIGSARGLDYLAITDHNDIRAQSDPGFGAHGVIALPSYENSLAGHAQMHGATRVYNNAQPLQALADELRADGGVFQVNHPAGESVDWHHDADWAPARDGSYEGDVVPDTVEVWNISWLWQPPAPSANSLDDAVRYWEGWLDRGEKVGLTGGSDNHYVATTPIQGVGQPTTWVFATERSTRGVLEALRAGRTSVSHQPPLLRAPQLQLEADADGDGIYESRLGDTVASGAALRARVANAAGGLLRIVTTGGVQLRVPVPALTPVFEHRFTVPAGTRWVRAELVEPDAAEQRAILCDDALGDQTTYCRNRLGVLAMSSALYLQ